MKHIFIREKALCRRNCVFKTVDLFEYSEEEAQAAKLCRKKKLYATIPKNKSLNDKHSRNMFEWVIHNNFDKRDYSATLTFENAPTAQNGKRLLDNYIKRLRRLYRKNGVRLDYVVVTEEGLIGKRLHYHLILNSGNGTIKREDIENLWKEGFCNVDRLRPNENGLLELCHYLEKSQKNAAKYKRAWTCSTHLKHPEITVNDNSISRKRMRAIQNAARNDEAKQEIEKMYKGWKCIGRPEIGTNEVTGRQYAHFKLIRKPSPCKARHKPKRTEACTVKQNECRLNLRI